MCTSRFFSAIPLRFLAGSILSLILLACASKNPKSTPNPYTDPCKAMKLEIAEKQELDAKIKSLSKQAVKYQKRGDTASANSAERRLQGMRVDQRLRQESLERSSYSCQPLLDRLQEPTLDPEQRKFPLREPYP